MSGRPDNPLAQFVRRLRLHSHLSDSDAEAILDLPYRLVVRERHSFVMRQGDDLPHICIVISGFVERHRISQNGDKQVLYFYIPGDPLNLESLFSVTADDALQIVKSSELAVIKCAHFRELIQRRPSLMDCVVRSILVDASAFREWIFNLGQRDARARIAHLMCELGYRMRALDLTDEALRLPMTQMHIAEATGLTPIHVNRTLRAMQSEGLISYKPASFQILDWNNLVEVADFNPRYLHTKLGATHLDEMDEIPES